ncbi:hypothetical protein NL676_007376 [Syzygium grande]|nr:hypothetical protein NL676_007376 [Syzygium grande]
MTHSLSTLYFLIFLTVLIRTSAHHAAFCYDTIGNFTPNSAYAKNRETILSYLSNNVSAHDGFYFTSTGQDPNTIYALTFCRGNTLTNICEKCVTSVADDLVEKCPNQKAAFSWGTDGDPCFIRYSDTPIYRILQTDPTLLVDNIDNITMSPAIWWNLTLGVVNKAVDSTSKLKFATGQANLPDNRTIYSLLQCSPDLSANNCRTCLDETIDYYDECCRGRQASGVYKPSCIFRWDFYPFADSSHSPLSLSPPPPAAPPAPGRNIDKGTLAATIVSVAVFVMLLFIGCRCLRRRRAQKKNEAAQEECGVSEIASFKSLQFDLDTLLSATNNFSQENKLGEGGFGEVYQVRK